jgi:DNA repair exonuclease SbcCD ATPase subunit
MTLLAEMLRDLAEAKNRAEARLAYCKEKLQEASEKLSAAKEALEQHRELAAIMRGAGFVYPVIPKSDPTAPPTPIADPPA